MTPQVLQSYYYNVFSTDQGQAVLNDIKLLLTGSGLESYSPVDITLPHNELAAQAATKNVWDCIEGLTADLPRKKMGKRELVKELWKIYKTK